MCMIELVDFNEIYTNEKAKKTTRRSRRGRFVRKQLQATEECNDAVTEVEEQVENLKMQAEEAEKQKKNLEEPESES